MPFLSAASGVVSGVNVTGVAVAGQVPVASTSAAGAWAYPPGFEWSYTQITANANVTDTSEATATALISPGSFTPDGGAVICEFYCVQLIPPSTNGGFVCVTLFEGSTELARLALVQNNVAGSQATPAGYGRFRFTPSSAAHTYKICGFCSVTTGTPAIVAGAGGTGVNSPAFVRFSKV